MDAVDYWHLLILAPFASHPVFRVAALRMTYLRINHRLLEGKLFSSNMQSQGKVVFYLILMKFSGVGSGEASFSKEASPAISSLSPRSPVRAGRARP